MIIDEIAFISATLMWVYRAAPFMCLKALFMMLFIQDLSKSCGMEVYRVENLMFEWKLFYGLLSELMMTVNLWNF